MFTTAGLAFSFVRSSEEESLRDEQGHEQHILVALCKSFNGRSWEALRAEHYKMNRAKMTSYHDCDEFLNIIDSCRDRPNAISLPEGSAYRQYEGIQLEAL